MNEVRAPIEMIMAFSALHAVFGFVWGHWVGRKREHRTWRDMIAKIAVRKSTPNLHAVMQEADAILAERDEP
jgi:hypothetical protein